MSVEDKRLVCGSMVLLSGLVVGWLSGAFDAEVEYSGKQTAGWLIYIFSFYVGGIFVGMGLGGKSAKEQKNER